VMRSGQALYTRLESAPEDAGSPRLVITSKRPLRSRAGAVIGIAGCSRLVEDTQEQGRGANALAVVIDRLHKDFAEPLRAADLADLAGMSVARLERLFRRAFGASLRQYIIRVRVENAMRMLTDTDESVSATAQSCGFYDHAHFSRAFRRFTGETPSEFREKRSLAAASVPRST
ncbi:MAG: helix-turn-helix transcriptional regulator, partial [Planctomycetota bacterium]